MSAKSGQGTDPIYPTTRRDFDFGRDVGDIFHTVPTNVFLVKATYWIGR